MQSRARAIEALLDLVTDQAVIVCGGHPSREAFALKDRPTHLYLTGSMGVAAAVGLGVALNKPDKKVVVLDGDGNLLMGLGTLATVGALKPRNLVHVVLDNEVYGSSGNQPSYSRVVRLDQIAKAAGYVQVERVLEREDLVYEFNTMLNQEGPSLLLVKVTEQAEDVGPVPLEPAQLTERFRKAIG
jgi:thiamine pyrophosphate-dependent acetolactate synthase large subunit-like protein